MKIKTTFIGSPAIAARLLTTLLESELLDIVLVVTREDKPVGKHLEYTPTPVKQCALMKGIQVFDSNIRDEATQKELIDTIKYEKVELGILYAYGALVPNSIIDLFPQGIWNVHPSLLPRYRGPSPTAYPLLFGEHETGVSIMKLVQKLDAGPILSQTKIEISGSVKREDLEKQLTDEGANLIIKNAQQISNKTVLTTNEQDHSKSTYTRLLKKTDGYISSQLIRHAISGDESRDETLPEIIKEYMMKYDTPDSYTAAEIVYNMYRAFSPWPGIWTTVETKSGIKRLLIRNVEMNSNKITIGDVQLEGKKPVDFQTFIKAYNFI